MSRHARKNASLPTGSLPAEIVAALSSMVALGPRGLCREDAARYVGVGTTKFEQMTRDGRMPRPKLIDGRRVWDRWELDRAFGALPDDGAQTGEWVFAV